MNWITNNIQIIIIAVIFGSSILQWAAKKAQEQREIAARRRAADRQEQEALRTGRPSPTDEPDADGPMAGSAQARQQSEIARQRQEQASRLEEMRRARLEQIRQQQRERLEQARARRQSQPGAQPGPAQPTRVRSGIPQANHPQPTVQPIPQPLPQPTAPPRRRGQRSVDSLPLPGAESGAATAGSARRLARPTGQPRDIVLSKLDEDVWNVDREEDAASQKRRAMLRQAIVWSELLKPPLSMREDRDA